MKLPVSKLFAIFLAGLVMSSANALDPEPDAVFIRVIDTGPGHAAVILMPGDHFMVYDTGHWNQDNLVRDRVREIIPMTEY